MKIVIAGAGKLGLALTGQLSREGHDITVIDNRPEMIESVSNREDVASICGNAVSYDVLIQAGIPSADLLIAVTTTDEINIITCLIAKKMGVRHTIARVRSPEYSKSLVSMQEELGLSLSVNPELSSAMEVSRILRFPSASKVEFFSKGRVEMTEIRVTKETHLDGVKLSDFPSVFKSRLLVSAVDRAGKTIIPRGDFVLQEGDTINIASTPTEMARFFREIGLTTKKSHHVLLVGGGTISYYLAKQLLATGTQVKILEIDRQRCEDLAVMLPKAVIINGDGTDRDTLTEEGLQNVDALVAETGLDEENVVIAMYALSQKIPKVIAKIDHITFGEILEKTGIESAFAPHSVAASRIIRYVRGIQSAGGGQMEALFSIMNGKAEAIEFKVNRFRGEGVPLKQLRLRDNVLVVCITRRGKAIFPSGDDYILKGDNVIITTVSAMDEIDDILL